MDLEISLFFNYEKNTTDLFRILFAYNCIGLYFVVKVIFRISNSLYENCKTQNLPNPNICMTLPLKVRVMRCVKSFKTLIKS